LAEADKYRLGLVKSLAAAEKTGNTTAVSSIKEKINITT